MEIYKNLILVPIDYKKKVAFISIDNVAKSWTFEIDWNFPAIEEKPKMFLNSEENGKSLEVKEEEERSLHLLAISEAHNLMAFTTSDKSLFLCRLNESSASILSRRLFSRTSSVLKFSSCGQFLFLCDKTGDTFEYDCKDVNKPGRWIFGHISQVLELSVSADLR